MSRKLKQAAPVYAGREAAVVNRRGTGAPPSNTAPDNSNPVFFQPLRWGIDSLYLSYPGELSSEVEAQLKALKKQAQGKDHEAAKAQLVLGDHIFEVRDKSSGLFAYSLADGAFEIRLSASRSKKLPMAYVQVRSGLLAHRSVDSIEQELRGILRLMGEVSFPKVSRIDLYVDFASAVDMEGWDRDAWVTRASSVVQYAENSTFTGWTIGEGGSLMGRLYLKSLECKKSGKEYLLDLWLQAGWDGLAPVWRLEFEFRREVLAQLGMDALPHVMEHLGGLWSYASTEWLKLCVPNEADSTRSRWPIHPLWVALASIDWETEGGPLSRTFTASRAPARTWLGTRALSLVASMGSVAGVDLARNTAWLNQTKNGTPRGVPLNVDAVQVLREQLGKHPRFCFTHMGEPIRWQLSNSGWVTALDRAGIKDFRFHDLRHTWASWHRQAGTSCDELKDLGGWKSREMVDRYAKFATENLSVAASRIEMGRDTNGPELARFRHA